MREPSGRGHGNPGRPPGVEAVMRNVTSLVAGVAAAAAVVAGGCGSGPSSQSPARLPPLSSGSRPAPGAALYPQPGRVEYRVGAALPALPAQAPAYRMAGTTTVARVARLAVAFGLTGPVTTDPSGWTVADAEQTLHVQRAGGLPWTFGRVGGGDVVAGCAVASPGVSVGSGSASAGGAQPSAPPATCPPPTTVPGLPSSADAARVAEAALTRAGFDVAGAVVRTSGGSSAWEVTIEPAVAGVAVVASPWSVAVGANRVILSGSGYLADPRPAGEYALVDVPAGVLRLQQGAPWIVYGGPGPVPMRGVPDAANAGASTGDAPAVAPAEPPATVACPPGAPCPTLPVPPVVVRTITGVRLGLGWWTAADPTVTDAWLLPVYVFALDDGGTIPVLAVADRYLTPPSTTTTGPEPEPATRSS